jgi:hypothetical protein
MKRSKWDHIKLSGRYRYLVIILSVFHRLTFKHYGFYYYHQGPPCPSGMTSLMGRCLGLVKNSGSSTTKNEVNCYWKSGDLNYQIMAFTNDQVNMKTETKFDCLETEC